MDYLLSAIEQFGVLVEPAPTGAILPDLKDLPFYEVVMEKREDDAPGDWESQTFPHGALHRHSEGVPGDPGRADKMRNVELGVRNSPLILFCSKTLLNLFQILFSEFLSVLKKQFIDFVF